MTLLRLQARTSTSNKQSNTGDCLHQQNLLERQLIPTNTTKPINLWETLMSLSNFPQSKSMEKNLNHSIPTGKRDIDWTVLQKAG